MLRSLVAFRRVLHKFHRFTAGRIHDCRDAHGKGENVLGARASGTAQVQRQRVGCRQERVAANHAEVVSPVARPVTIRKEETLVDTSVNLGPHMMAVCRREVVEELCFTERWTGRVDTIRAVVDVRRGEAAHGGRDCGSGG